MNVTINLDGAPITVKVADECHFVREEIEKALEVLVTRQVIKSAQIEWDVKECSPENAEFWVKRATAEQLNSMKSKVKTFAETITNCQTPLGNTFIESLRKDMERGYSIGIPLLKRTYWHIWADGSKFEAECGNYTYTHFFRKRARELKKKGKIKEFGLR